MITPGVLIANASQQFNLSRGLIQPMPPVGDVFGLIEPGAHHVVTNRLPILVVLVGHVLRPVHQFIQAQWPEPHDCETCDLLEFKATQNVSKAKEVKKDHWADHFCVKFMCLSFFELFRLMLFICGNISIGSTFMAWHSWPESAKLLPAFLSRCL